MNDTTEQSADAPEPPEGPGLPSAFTRPQIENVLTLDRIMNSARKARRIARICLRGDLEAEYLDALDQLGDLVDEHGQMLNEDASIGDVEEVTGLRDRVAALRAEMAAETYSVVFEGMASDEWDAFEKQHRDKTGAVKDPTAYNNALIIACAISPKINADDLAVMRQQLRPTQITELANQAYSACATGGVDVPKLPNYSRSPKPEESSLS